MFKRKVIISIQLESDFDDINQKHFANNIVNGIDKKYSPKIVKHCQIIQ